MWPVMVIRINSGDRQQKELNEYNHRHFLNQ